MAENEMVGGHHQLGGREFEQAPGDDKAQGSLGCCRPRHHKEPDTTEQLNSKNRKGLYMAIGSSAGCMEEFFDCIRKPRKEGT